MQFINSKSKKGVVQILHTHF